MANLTGSTPTPVTSANNGGQYERSPQMHPDQLDEIALAYLLKWTDTEVVQTNLHGLTQLRSCIQEHSNFTDHLFVFRGLPIDHGVALKEEVDIDVAFIEAHAGRRSYRPLKRAKASWAHYDYPELIRQSTTCSDRQPKAVPHDVIGEPPTHITSTTGDGVMFCRASIWLSEKAHILYLDRAAWKISRPGVARRYKAYTTEKIPDENSVSMITMEIDADGNVTTLGDEIPSLEMMLHGSLRNGFSSSDDLMGLLEDLVMNKWDEFFETLGLDLTVGLVETTALFSQALSSLERNLSVSRQRAKIRHRSIETLPDTYPLLGTTPQSTTAEWEVLLSRLNRRAQLLRHLRPVMANVGIPAGKPSVPTNAAADLDASLADGHNTKCNSKSRDSYNSGMDSSTSNESQRSLNRVTYLGGVLLPFSVVSGILAIDEPYGPGNSQFWVFWAVTVPLVLFTLVVMYADSIRKAEVWVEDAAAASGKPSDDEVNIGSGLLGRVPVAPDVEQAVPVGRFAESIFFSPTPTPISVPVPEAAVVEDEDDADANEAQGEPDRMVEKRHWRNPAAQDAEYDPGRDEWARKKRWRKEQLGWMGAFAMLFRLYKVKKGVPPRHLRRS
ncbi:hypothetical protein F4825DRAFT_459840 [Nemania diffusa]|nr:hypothetical protein F4825DRAFT_459840 [Nemania diffusa]